MKIMIFFYYQLIKCFWIFVKSYLNLLTKIKYKKKIMIKLIFIKIMLFIKKFYVFDKNKKKSI